MQVERNNNLEDRCASSRAVHHEVIAYSLGSVKGRAVIKTVYGCSYAKHEGYHGRSDRCGTNEDSGFRLQRCHRLESDQKLPVHAKVARDCCTTDDQQAPVGRRRAPLRCEYLAVLPREAGGTVTLVAVLARHRGDVARGAICARVQHDARVHDLAVSTAPP